MVSFRREKYVPRGGPSGGDGGRGGDVALKVDANINTLYAFRKHVHFRAGPGGKGGSSNKTGADAERLIVPVPAGTVIRDAATGGLIADLLLPEAEAVVRRWRTRPAAATRASNRPRTRRRAWRKKANPAANAGSRWN